MTNYFMKDEVYPNSWFGFDYSFCNRDCNNNKCGRNKKSESYKTMIKVEPIHSESDFSSKCKKYIKEDDE